MTRFQVFTVVAAAFSLQYSAAEARQCVIADQTDTTLNVRNSPNGAIVNRLKNGRVVSIITTRNDSKGRSWGYATGKYKGRNRKWGWIFMEGVDCGSATASRSKSNTRRPSGYPLFMDGSKALKPFGMHIGDYDRPGTKAALFGRKCFYYGDGGPALSLSKQTVKTYSKKGFSFDQMCGIFRIENLRYHPETGNRLPTYLIGNSREIHRLAGQYPDAGVIGGEFLLDIPRCMRNAKLNKGIAKVTITARCKTRYDVKTGRKLSPSQRKSQIEFVLWGDAGPSGDLISNKLLVDSQRRNTKADIASVLKRR